MNYVVAEPIMVPGSHEALLANPDHAARAVITAADVAELRTPAVTNG